MAINITRLERNLQRIVDAIIELTAGRNNATGSFTITTGATTTTVNAPNCSADSQVFIRPLDANARSEAAATSTYVSTVGQGFFTVTHPNNGTTRTWGFLATGG